MQFTVQSNNFQNTDWSKLTKKWILFIEKLLTCFTLSSLLQPRPLIVLYYNYANNNTNNKKKTLKKDLELADLDERALRAKK